VKMGSGASYRVSSRGDTETRWSVQGLAVDFNFYLRWSDTLEDGETEAQGCGLPQPCLMVCWAIPSQPFGLLTG
jgi:hypothetical protein